MIYFKFVQNNKKTGHINLRPILSGFSMKGQKRGRTLKERYFIISVLWWTICGFAISAPAHLRKLVADLRFADKKIFACPTLILNKLPTVLVPKCICPLSWSVHHNFACDGIMVHRVKGGGRAPRAPFTPGWADFTIMMECTPESDHCHSVCTLWHDLRVWSEHSVLAFKFTLSLQGADPPPPFLIQVAKTGKNHMNEEITPSSPLRQASDIAKPYKL
jgi:hypothetical protein